MNKKILRGSLAGVAVIALAAGGNTLAAWSDFDEIADNKAGAGVLKLSVGANGGNDAVKFDQVKMAPGQIGTQRNVYVASNDGDSTPSGRLFMSLKNLDGIEDGCNGNGEITVDPDCADTKTEGEFIEDSMLQVLSYVVNKPSECGDTASLKQTVTPQYGGSLKTWMSKSGTPYELTGDYTAKGGANRSYLAPGQGLCVSMTLNLATGVNNASQGDAASFLTRFDLEQAPHGTPRTPIA